MQNPIPLGICFVVLAASAASAGAPDPANSTVTLSAPIVPCQYRFNLGSPNLLTVTVVVHDSDDDPCASTSVEVELSGAGGTPGNFCTCCPSQTGTTDSNGQVQLTFGKIGGAGLLRVSAVAHASPDVALNPVDITFTSTDLDGACESTSSVNLADEGLFGLAISPYGLWGDYNCSGSVNVVDLGIFAGALTIGCTNTSPCP